MFGFNKKMFVVLLTCVFHASNHRKYISLNCQQCMTQPTLINLHLNQYSQGWCYYPFAVNLDRCVGGCSTLRICVSNKTRFKLECF